MTTLFAITQRRRTLPSPVNETARHVEISIPRHTHQPRERRRGVREAARAWCINTISVVGKATGAFTFPPKLASVVAAEKLACSDTTSKWKHPDVPGTSGVYPVKKVKVIYHVAGNQDQPVKLALSDPGPTRAGLVVHNPRRARHGDASDHQAG